MLDFRSICDIDAVDLNEAPAHDRSGSGQLERRDGRYS